MSHSSLRTLDHRPWPIPSRAWKWRQSWCDLLFAHWRVAAEQVRHLVPAELTLQTWDGDAWIGLVPFRMEGVMRRPLPDLPGISAFPELNVRTYVEHGGKPGVWFFSLDATNRLAVWAARRFFHLPYFRASITAHTESTYGSDSKREHHYSARRWPTSSGPTWRAQYGPIGDTFLAQTGTLDHWLTERYCLYAQSPRNEIYCCDVHHVPWPLQNAVATLDVADWMESHHSLRLTGDPDALHYAHRVDVVTWNPYRVV